jgi:magnesium chelatase subunit H
LQILGRQFGNLLVAVQPTFGYEDDPMRLLMATNASPHHGFAAFYTYLDKVYQTDAVLHFGTHGAMEFMPGKQIGLSARCWSDRLIADLPNFYLYSVNNPSEGTIAKRRGFATLISYLSPPMESAGLYQNFVQLKDLINLYRKQVAEGFDFKSALSNRQTLGAADSGMPDNTAFSALIDSIGDLARTVELKSKFDAYTSPDSFVIDLYNQLLEVEERLIPSGLHIVDEPPDLAGLTDMLNSIASFDRGKPGSDEEARALPTLIAEGFGWNIEELRKNARQDNDTLARWERLTRIQRHAVNLFIEGLLQDNPPSGKHKAAKYLLEEAKVSLAASENMFDYLVEVADALRNNTEIQQIIRAFNGEYIEPSSGNDIVRNPAVLPTGRNIHALDPSLVPSPVARRLGEKSCKAVLERARVEMGLPEGQYPETIAMVLWGTDNIKTDGEGVAQALYLMGARAIADGMGKVSGVKLLPLAELGRPRIDVVCTVSGIFRDLMPNQMELLDRAARLAAQANEPSEMNFIKKHVDEEMAKGVSFEEAAARVFSNAPGNYGANVNFMVDSGSWENEDELAEAFLNRKGFAFGVKAQGEEARKLMESALSRVQLSFQNVDSAEIGITDVDHYFEYLGGISKTVEKLNGGKRPPALLADSLSATSGGLGQGNNIRTIEEMVRLESRTKLLNPKWYEGMLKFGYEGVREIEVRVTNTYGWSATAKAVDNWVYNDIDKTFVQNEELRQRMIELNPYSFKGIVGRLLEANGRGYWEADANTIERLKELYAGLEDEIEGVGGGKLATNPNARVTG